MDLVVGATGNLGTEICRELRARKRPVRALVRAKSEPDKIAALRDLGVVIMLGDLKEPVSLQSACDGVDTVVSTASCTQSRSQGDDIESVDRAGQLELVGTAEACGVTRFVYVSFPQTHLSFPLQDAKRAVETALVTSGMNYTVLRPPHFLEGWFSPALGFDATAGKARLFGEGAGAMSWVSMYDVARVAAACVENSAAQRKMITFGGPAAVSQRDVLALFEQAAGNSFEVEHVPVELLEQQLEHAETPLERSFAALMLIAGSGADWRFDNAELDGLVDFELRSVQQFARSFFT